MNVIKKNAAGTLAFRFIQPTVMEGHFLHCTITHTSSAPGCLALFGTTEFRLRVSFT